MTRRAGVAGVLVMAGVSHQATSLEMRERLAIDAPRWREVEPDGLRCVLLSTCNRVEVYAWTAGRPATALGQIERALARAADVPIEALRPLLVRREGITAVAHLVRVAAGLDSLVVGEEQISGQVREAIREAEPVPGRLAGVFQRAIDAAKRVRGATRLAKHPSIAVAGVHVAMRDPALVSGGLAGGTAVVLGAGVMAKSGAGCLVELGVPTVVLNRTPHHARLLAAKLGIETSWASLDDLPYWLERASLVVAATASRRPVLDIEMLRSAVAVRDRPLVLLDLAVPRDVDARARALEGVTLIDLDDLERLCPLDAPVRSAEMARAEQLALGEAATIDAWLRVRAASPVIAELRQYGEHVRATELRRSERRLKDLTPEQREAVEALTSGIVNKLLHGPTLALRDAAVEPRSLARSRTLVSRVMRLDRAQRTRVSR